MRNYTRVLALVAGLGIGVLGIVGAYAGMWSQLPAATSSPGALAATTLPLTGSETGAFDTNLSGGRNPQTETISVDQLKTYMFGNSGTSSSTINTKATATAGAATCNADRCIVTSEALTTGTSQSYTLNVSSTVIQPGGSIVLANVYDGTNTVTGATITTVNPICSGTNCAARIVVQNRNTGALNGTLKFSIVTIN